MSQNVTCAGLPRKVKVISVLGGQAVMARRILAKITEKIEHSAEILAPFCSAQSKS